MTFQQFLRILRARRWIIVGVFVGLFSITLAVSLLLPKMYTATTILVVDMKMNDPVMGNSPIGSNYLATQLDIIGSERVAQRVIEMNPVLMQIQVYKDAWKEETGGEGDFKVWLAGLFQHYLDVRPSRTRESSTIEINYKAPNPQFAAALANAFAKAYIATNLELRVDPARQYAEWFSSQNKSLRDDLEAAQHKLSAYEQEHKILIGDGRFDVENMRLSELNTQLSIAQGQRAESYSRESEVGSAESLPEVMANPVIAGLKTDLARHEADRSQLLDRLGKNHPQVTQLNEQIAELRQRIAAETRRVATSIGTTSRISTARIAEITEAIDKQQARVLELKKHRDQLAVLQRDVENARRAYDLVTQRFEQTRLEGQTQQTNISVLTEATPPLKHSSPRLVLNLVIATFLGTLLGVAVALLLELLDQRIRGSEDLAQFAGIPVLGIIPAASARAVVRTRRRRLAAA
ncbi:MAG: chain length determinant protein EpsF [Azoarcus sp.]|jgi:chain length determinant protein EpsF|nr:chain length determinant protein EpsF [Azoarcus sp.]